MQPLNRPGANPSQAIVIKEFRIICGGKPAVARLETGNFALFFVAEFATFGQQLSFIRSDQIGFAERKLFFGINQIALSCQNTT